MSFASLKFQLCSASVIAVLYIISQYIEPCDYETWLYHNSSHTSVTGWFCSAKIKYGLCCQKQVSQAGISNYRVHSRQGNVREKWNFSMSGNCQWILQSVREILTFGKIDEKRHGISHNVRENDHFKQHDSPVSTYIDQCQYNLNQDLEILSNKYLFK